MKLTVKNKLINLDTFVILGVTLFAVIRNEVTIFYIIYLFWFQEFIRKLIDFIFQSRKKSLTDWMSFLRISLWGGFIMLIYLIFIIVFFAIMLNWNDSKVLNSNISILLFDNWYFNSNIILLFFRYLFIYQNTDSAVVQFDFFSCKLLALHISIILGILIYGFVPFYFDTTNVIASSLIILPFLAVKIIFDYKELLKVNF